MRQRARVDSNHSTIAKAFRDLQCSWQDTHQLGDGRQDGIAGISGINVLVEVKDGSKPPSKRKLTDDETEFHDNWRGFICIVESVDDVIALVASVRRALSTYPAFLGHFSPRHAPVSRGFASVSISAVGCWPEGEA